ncbi:hypothetical protein MKD33_07610, partial [Chromobacterium piscinae]
AGALLAW